MTERIERLVAALRREVSGLDAARLSPVEAARLVEVLSDGERACQAGRALAAERALRARIWRAAGYRTPAQWIAARAKSSLSAAITTVQTAHRLTEFPATREAFVSGRLSEVQAAEITAAAAADPASEQSLLSTAASETVGILRERCREVRAAAAGDEAAIERIRRGRYLRNWTDRDGAVRLDGRLAPDDGARLLAAVTARAARLVAEAKRSGHREPAEAYAADALVAIAAGAPGPKAVVHVHVDQSALERGRTAPGETCRIPGVGPISVAVARRLAADGVVKALAADGSDVRAVAHLGRTIPARLRTALESRDVACVVPGCEVRTGLEIDHVVPLGRGGTTSLANLARLCRYHHAQKTHYGWRLGGGPGAWTWTRAGSEIAGGSVRPLPRPAPAPPDRASRGRSPTGTRRPSHGAL